MNARTFVLVGLWSIGAAVVIAEEGGGRLRIPDDAAQKEALELVKNVFSSEYKSRVPAEQAKLARTMLDQAASTGEPASQFVLLREARTIATAAGDVRLAILACDELIQRFDLSPMSERVETLESLSTSAKTADAAHALMHEARSSLEHALAAFDYATALRYAILAEKAAVKAKDTVSLAAVRKRKSEISTLKSGFEKFSRSEEVLKANPDDPTANLVTGKYLCFLRNAWDTGLPRLAKGGDAGLEAIARESLKMPSDPAQQALLANQWWEFAETLEGAERDGVRAYATYWYGLAVGKLTGLSKALAEKRLAEAKTVAVARQPRRQVNLLAMIDLQKDIIRGNWTIVEGALQCPRGHMVPTVRIPFELPEEYDVSFVFSQPRFRNGVGVLLPNRHGGVFSVYALEDRGSSYGISVHGQIGRGNPTNREYPGVAQPNQMYKAVAQVRKGSVKLLINDKLVASYEGDFSALKTGAFHDLKNGEQFAVFCDDPTTFRSIELVEVNGEGKPLR